MQILRKPEMVSLSGLVKLVINDEILDKIKFLCKNIADVEWSGVLFYKVNGSIKDISTLSLEVVDIFLMHKGTKTYTEYTFDGDIAEFMMDKMIQDESWQNIKMGHIHSHNSMNVFFSGTDTDELLDNCVNHSYYLSLIVNNYMDMTAKVAFKTTQNTFTAYDEEGNPYELELELKNPKVTMLTYDCQIEAPTVSLVVPTEFESRYQHIISKAKREAEEAKAKAAKAYKPPVNGNNYGIPPVNTPSYGKAPLPAQDWNQNRFPAVIDEPIPFEDHDNGVSGNIFPLEDDLDLTGINEEFTCFLLRKGEIVPNDNIADALKAVATLGEPVEGLAQHMVTNFTTSYAEFFNELAENNVMEDYLDVLEAIIENIEEFEQVKYPFINDLVDPLREFSMQVENAWKDVIYPKTTV